MVLMRDLSKVKVAVKSYRILYTTVLLGCLLYLGSTNTVHSVPESSLLHGVGGYYSGSPKQAEIITTLVIRFAFEREEAQKQPSGAIYP
jgi:hypothetical protein